MATRQYTRGLQKLFTRFYGPTLPDGTTPLPEGVSEGDLLPPELYIDLLGDDICMALVDVFLDTQPPPGTTPDAYAVNFHSHEYLLDVVGSEGNPEWTSSDPSWIIRHSSPLTDKKIIYTTNNKPSDSPDGYLEVMFDCADVTLENVPAGGRPRSEAVILYKRVLKSDVSVYAGPNDIDLTKSPLIAYFDGSSVFFTPNENDVEVVISNKGLMRWGVGYDPVSP